MYFTTEFTWASEQKNLIDLRRKTITYYAIILE
jgi:hypothetical protein